MEDWKNTKCGTCIVQRQKPICNSCLGHQFYKSMSNADKIRNMSDEELAEFLCEISMCKPDYCPAYDKCMRTEHGTMKGWLQSEVKDGE